MVLAVPSFFLENIFLPESAVENVAHRLDVLNDNLRVCTKTAFMILCLLSKTDGYARDGYQLVINRSPGID